MFKQVLSVQSPNADVAERGGMLKITALLIFVATCAMLAVFQRDVIVAGFIPINLVVIIGAALAFGLAHVRRITLGGLLLTAVLLAAIAGSAMQNAQASGENAVAYVVPILIAGLIVGSNAVLGIGALALVLTLLPELSGVLPWSSRALPLIMLLMLATGFIWLTIYRLERAFGKARHQAEAAIAAQHDLSERQSAIEATNQELVNTNQQMASLLDLVRDLETPVIPLLEGVLVLPIVGHMDTRRTSRLTETVLQAVYDQRATTIIIDITGVNTVDTEVAQRIQQLARAINMLGTRVLLTGIRADIAHTIVAQGIDLTGIETTGRLQDGVASVLNNLKIAPVKTLAVHGARNGA